MKLSGIWALIGVYLMMPIAVRADPIIWKSTRAEAVEAALNSGKLVLLVAGSETCAYTQFMKANVCETPDVRQVIDASYVGWFCDVETSTEWLSYVAGMGGILLPLMCVIDPTDPAHYLDRSMDIQSESVFLARLNSHLPYTPEVPDGLDNDGDGQIDEGARVSKTCFSLAQTVRCAGAGWSRTFVMDLTNFRNIAVKDGYRSYTTDYSLYYNIWTGIYLYDYDTGAFGAATWLTNINL